MERENNTRKMRVVGCYQSFDGEDMYPTLEEKAANLLYFVTKNHDSPNEARMAVFCM